MNHPYSIVLLFVSCCLFQRQALSQTPAADINYAEARIPTYTLPDPLRSSEGKRIVTVKEWVQKQRPYLLQLFADHVYGRMPGRPGGQYVQVRSIDSAALGGMAIRKQVRIFFSKTDTTARLDLLLYLPKKRKGRVPVFLGLNFAGNQTIQPDPGIFLSSSWIADVQEYRSVNNKATEASRGVQAHRWPVVQLLSRGYGLATAYYGDLEPDHIEGWKTGVRSSLQNSLNIRPEQWGGIGAWAWGLSRMMDYLETEPGIHPRQVILTGHSRLGKAALWAAANDTRFAMIISNESGEGGAALARRWFGETIERINTAFPHWFAPAFKNYNGHPERLPVDQHELLSLLAPRPLYIASAKDDQWADPKGEFLSGLHAGAVYQLLGRQGLSVRQMPPVNTPVGSHIRYHMRSGKHDMLSYDWEQFLQFADSYFKTVR